MSADVTMWVEVEVTSKEWRKSYGVTSEDALENADLEEGERLTGKVRDTPEELTESEEESSKSVMEINEYGTKCWFLDGKLHREDGPAVDYISGYKYWYLNGIEVTEEEVMGK